MNREHATAAPHPSLGHARDVPDGGPGTIASAAASAAMTSNVMLTRRQSAAGPAAGSGAGTAAKLGRTRRGSPSDANTPTTASAADSRKTGVNDPAASAMNPPSCGEIIWATPKQKVVAAKAGP